jgi:hypothetical protein
MIVYADADYRLEADGLEEDTRPVVFTARCQHCQAVLSSRTYYTPPGARYLEAAAAQDAEAALAHICLGRRVP